MTTNPWHWFLGPKSKQISSPGHPYSPPSAPLAPQTIPTEFSQGGAQLSPLKSLVQMSVVTAEAGVRALAAPQMPSGLEGGVSWGTHSMAPQKEKEVTRGKDTSKSPFISELWKRFSLCYSPNYHEPVAH